MKKQFTTLTFLFIALHSGAQLSEGLVAWYPLDGTANDSSGRGNHGSIYGGVSLASNRYGVANKAFHFDGTSGYISCPNDTMLTNHKSFSFSLWFKVTYRPAGWDQNIVIANIGAYQNSGGFENVIGNPPLTTSYSSMYRNGSYQDQPLAGTLAIDSGMWFNQVATFRYNPVADSTSLTNYLNGVADDSTIFAGNVSWYNISPLYIGTNYDGFLGYQRNFLGDIDDVRIWNRALSLTDISVITAVQEVPADRSEIYLAPNPSNGSFTILCNDPKLRRVQIFNAIGKRIFEHVTNDRTITIHLPESCKGICLVKVTGDNENRAIKLMVE